MGYVYAHFNDKETVFSHLQWKWWRLGCSFLIFFTVRIEKEANAVHTEIEVKVIILKSPLLQICTLIHCVTAFFEFNVIGEKNINLKATGDPVVAGESNLGAIIVDGFVIFIYWLHAVFVVQFYGTAFWKFFLFQVSLS